MAEISLSYKNFSAFIVEPIDIGDVEITDTTPETVTPNNWQIEHKKAVLRDENSEYYKDDKYRQSDLFEANLITQIGKILIVVDENGFFFGKINFIKHNDDYRFMYLYVAGDRRDKFYSLGIKNYERSCFIMWKFASLISGGEIVITCPLQSIKKYLRQLNAKFYDAKYGAFCNFKFILCDFDRSKLVDGNGESVVAVFTI